MNTTNTTQDVKTTQEGAWIGISEIDAPDYARPHKPEGLDSLGIDLGKNGQLQNIVLVKKADGRYECIIGNGRLEAAKKLGWSHIRADVKEGLSETQKLLMTLAENEEREDVGPFYTSDLYKRIMAAEGITKGIDLAAKLGKDEGDVSRILALADLKPEVREKLGRSNFSMRHLREILRLPTAEAQLKLAEACAKGDWSSRVLRAKVDQALSGGTEKVAKAQAEPARPFQLSRKGKGFLIRSQEGPTQDRLDDYIQDLRGAVLDFLLQEREAKTAKAA